MEQGNIYKRVQIQEVRTLTAINWLLWKFTLRLEIP